MFVGGFRRDWVLIFHCPIEKVLLEMYYYLLLGRGVTKYKFMRKKNRQGVWGPLKFPREYLVVAVRGAKPPWAQRFLGFKMEKKLFILGNYDNHLILWLHYTCMYDFRLLLVTIMKPSLRYSTWGLRFAAITFNGSARLWFWSGVL